MRTEVKTITTTEQEIELGRAAFEALGEAMKKQGLTAEDVSKDPEAVALSVRRALEAANLIPPGKL